MIDGLKIRITKDDLERHCLERAAYHRERAGVKESQRENLEAAVEEMKASPAAGVTSMNKGSYGFNPESALDQLDNDIKEHRNQAMVLTFYAEHLFDDDYSLGEQDLRRIQVIR